MWVVCLVGYVGFWLLIVSWLFGVCGCWRFWCCGYDCFIAFWFVGYICIVLCVAGCLICYTWVYVVVMLTSWLVMFTLLNLVLNCSLAGVLSLHTAVCCLR